MVSTIAYGPPAGERAAERWGQAHQLFEPDLDKLAATGRRRTSVGKRARRTGCRGAERLRSPCNVGRTSPGDDYTCCSRPFCCLPLLAFPASTAPVGGFIASKGVGRDRQAAGHDASGALRWAGR